MLKSKAEQVLIIYPAYSSSSSHRNEDHQGVPSTGGNKMRIFAVRMNRGVPADAECRSDCLFVAQKQLPAMQRFLNVKLSRLLEDHRSRTCKLTPSMRKQMLEELNDSEHANLILDEEYLPLCMLKRHIKPGVQVDMNIAISIVDDRK